MKYLDIVKKVLHKWLVSIEDFAPKFIAGLFVFFLFYMLSNTLSKLTVKTINKVFPNSRNQDSVRILANVFRFLFITAGAFIALEIMGLNGFLTNILGSLGVASIIAGVALKDIVSSMFSGFLVSFDKSFKDGDLVQINGVTGTVQDIGFLTTKIISDDGKKYYLPNQLIFSAPFINFSASVQRKVILSLEIPNSENLEKVKSIILDEITKLNGADHSQEAQVVFVKQSLGVYNLDAKFWLKPGENIAKVQSDAYVNIEKRLDQEGISITNPSQSPNSNT